MPEFSFLCVGFMKCGTTTFHEILKQHREIYLPIVKEPLYYSTPCLYKKGFQWYKERFYPKQIGEKYIGEINPSITMQNNARKVVRDYGKDIKLIFFLRNPVERLYSHFKYANTYLNYATGIEPRKKWADHAEHFDYIIKEAIKRDVQGNLNVTNTPYRSIIEMGNYYSVIKQYLTYFPIEQMKFVLLENYINEPESVCNDIFSFLGISKDNTINYKIKANEGNRIIRNDFCGVLFTVLSELRWKGFSYTPFLGEKIEEMQIKLWSAFRDKILMKRDKDKTVPSQKTKVLLQDYYRTEKNKLEELIGKKLCDLWYE